MATLASRRDKALWAILKMVAGAATASGLPTPALELPKQLAIGASDIFLLKKIYEIYFDEEIADQTFIEMLRHAGWITVSGAALAYGSIKLIEGCCAEALNCLPVAGWGISATITGSVTLTAGLAWWWLCDNAFRNNTSPIVEINSLGIIQ